MKRMPKVAVVGAGVAGSAVALALVRAGAEVHLFDQHPFHHAYGSSHGPTRLFRLAYFENPNYVPLLRCALESWAALENAADEQLFVRTGVMEAGLPDGPLLAGVRAAADAHGLKLESLSPQTMQARWPWFHLGESMEAVFETEAGFLLANRVLTAQVDLAQASGAVLHPSERVLEWTERGGGIRLRSEVTTYDVDRLVVATGIWAPELLGTAAPLRTLEKPLFWFAPGEDALHMSGSFTSFAVEEPDERFFYGFPAIDRSGIKLAEHTGGREISAPEARLGYATDEERGAAVNFVTKYIPNLRPEITREETCLYEMSPDGDFIIDRHPSSDRVSFAAGLSGHGFKFAPIIGTLLAELALDKDPNPDAGFLTLARFAD